MKRQDRLKEIETFWKRNTRYSHSDGYFNWYLRWEQITWEPFTVEGHPCDLKNPKVEQAIDDTSETAEGYYFWKWGWREEASGTLEWDWALLHLLYTWYLLPEDCNAPFFVNEDARAVCIPNYSWAHSLALLFQHPTSVLLGMEHMEVEEAAREAADQAKHEADAFANAGCPLLKREGALAFLNEDDAPAESPGAPLPSTTEVK